MLKYMRFLKNKVKKYDKAAKNPFYNNNIYPDFEKKQNSIFERTYLWVEKN